MTRDETFPGSAGARGRGRDPDEIIPPESFERRSERVRRSFWATFRRAAARLPFAEEVVAAYYCAFDAATPMRVRAMLLAALAYFVLPLDALPDLMPLVGFTDDVSVLAATIAMLRSHITERHRLAARRAIEAARAGGSPTPP